jgi:zinc protease
MMKRLTIAFALMTGACSHAPQSPEAAAGHVIPAPINTPFKLRPYSELTLSNGMKVVLVEDRSLPYVSYSLLVQSGSSEDPANLSGLANFVGELLDKGTKQKTATQFADEIGDMGAEVEVGTHYDYTLIQGSSLTLHQDRLLNAISSMVQSPTFAEAEIHRLQKQLIASRQKLPDSAAAFAGQAFDEMLYGTHPYGQPIGGTIKTLRAIRRKNVIQFYLRHYRPNNVLMAVVGQYPADIKERLETSFKGWAPRAQTASPVATMPENQMAIRLVTNPTLVQTQVVIGQRGIKRSDPDFLALRVANTILGGSFISRLNERVRIQLGLTYGVSSYFDARLETGPFEITTFTRNEKAGETVRETLGVVREFVAKGVTDAEVGGAKAYMVGTFPIAIETAEKFAFNLLYLRRYGIPDTYLSQYIPTVNHLTAREVNDAIQRHFDPTKMSILVYSEQKVRPELEKLGPVDVKNFTDIP